MTDEVRNPYDLFLKLQPKFRDIVLVPCGFQKYFAKTLPTFSFYPKLVADQSEPYIHPTYYRGDRDNGKFLQFNVQEAKFPFSFCYDPALEQGVGVQLDAAAGAAMLKGPLAGKFSVHVADQDQLKEVMLDNSGPSGITIALDYENRHIPGLVLPKALYATSWRFFFPGKSAETNAMELAVEYLRAQKDAAKLPQYQAENEQALARAATNYQTALKALAA